MAMKLAANKPAPGDHSSFVRKYVEIAVKPLENKNESWTIFFSMPSAEVYTRNATARIKKTFYTK